MNAVSGLMKFDYFLGHKYKPRKIWWEHAQDKAQWNANVRKIVEDPAALSADFADLGITERDLQKHAMIEVLPFNLDDAIQGGTGYPDHAVHATMLLVLYQQNETGQPQYYTMPLELATQA